MGAKLYHETDPETGVVWLVFTAGGAPTRLAPAGEVGGLLPPGNSLHAQRKLLEAAQCIREAAGALVPPVRAESPCEQPQVVDSELPPLPAAHTELEARIPGPKFYPVYTQETLLRYAEEARAPLLQQIKAKDAQIELLEKRLNVELAEAKGWKAQAEDLDQRLASKQREVDDLHHRWIEALRRLEPLQAQLAQVKEFLDLSNADLVAARKELAQLKSQLEVATQGSLGWKSRAEFFEQELAVYKQAEHLGKLVEALNILKEPEA